MSLYINPVLTDLVCCDSHCCSVIQDGQTALDLAREGRSYSFNKVKDEDDESRFDEVIKYLEECGK